MNCWELYGFPGRPIAVNRMWRVPQAPTSCQVQPGTPRPSVHQDQWVYSEWQEASWFFRQMSFMWPAIWSSQPKVLEMSNVSFHVCFSIHERRTYFCKFALVSWSTAFSYSPDGSMCHNWLCGEQSPGSKKTLGPECPQCTAKCHKATKTECSLCCWLLISLGWLEILQFLLWVNCCSETTDSPAFVKWECTLF